MSATQLRPHLFSPGRIGRLQVKNRLVMAPMVVQLGTENGAVTQRIIDYYERRAAGGVGLIVVEATYVHPSGRAFPCQLGLDRDGAQVGHFELVEAMHRHGAKVAVQIHHAGGRASPELTGGELIGPSAVPQDGIGTPRAMTGAEIESMAEAYAKAALRAQRAGYDAVELHGAHGFLIHQFLSPVTNRRTDEFGGTFDRRLRFAELVVRQVREAVGVRFPVIFRMSAEGGYGIEEAVEIAHALDEWGVDAIHVSIGGTAPQTLMPPDTSPMGYPEGWLLPHATAIKSRVKAPVIAVNEIRHPQFAEETLAQGKADFIALARPLLADPDWPAKAQAGCDEDIRPCISCAYCHLALRVIRPIRCLVNPEVGREREFASVAPARESRRVVVVGGGPAGLEAAARAAARGHTVTLYERASALGGQLRLAALPPHKEKIERLTAFLEARARKAGVDIMTGAEFKPAGLGAADVIIAGTGARPEMPRIPGASAGQVASAWDALQDKPLVSGKNVLVLGGYQMGCETAEFLALRGNKVRLVSRSREQDLAGDVVSNYRTPLLSRIRRLGVVLSTRCDIQNVSGNRATLLHHDGKQETVDADLIVVARGSEVVLPDMAALRAAAKEVHVVGDAAEPRTIAEAIYEGALAGNSV